MIKPFSFIISHMPHHWVIMTGGPGAPSLGLRGWGYPPMVLGHWARWAFGKALWGRWQLRVAFWASPGSSGNSCSNHFGQNHWHASAVTWNISRKAWVSSSTHIWCCMTNELGGRQHGKPSPIDQPLHYTSGLQLFKLHVMHHHLLFVHGCDLCHHLIQQLGWLYELWIWHASWVSAALW